MFIYPLCTLGALIHLEVFKVLAIFASCDLSTSLHTPPGSITVNGAHVCDVKANRTRDGGGGVHSGVLDSGCVQSQLCLRSLVCTV